MKKARPGLLLLLAAGCGGHPVVSAAVGPSATGVIPRPAEPLAAPGAGASTERAALDRQPVVEVSSRARACAEVLSHADSSVLRGAPGLVVGTVASGCRDRPLAAGVTLLEVFRTTSFPRHIDVDTIAVAPALVSPNGTWRVAVSAIAESEGMQNMRRGDASGVVEVVSAQRVDLVGDAAPELAFVLSVLEHPARRLDVVICDGDLSWCTKPVTVGRVGKAEDGF